ncbi:MAG: hypothetical protein ACN4GR_08910 [Arenicellales bacterium]
MKVIKRINPGQPGTKKHLAKFGNDLICVRYRHDQENNQRITTIELVVDKGFYRPELNYAKNYLLEEKNKLINLFIGYDESELRRKVIKAGGKWVNEKKCWEVKHNDAVKMGLKERIIK